MTSQAQQVLDQLKNQYDLIHSSFDEVALKCNDVQKDQLARALDDALTAWLEAQNTVLQANAPQVQRLSDEAARATAAIGSSLENLKDIQATLNTITQAVKGVLAIVRAAS